MGSGYTRTDVEDGISTGSVIDADLFDGEYDAIEAAFDGSTGHTHSGASSEGGPVSVIGPAQDFIASAGSFAPKTSNAYDLGTTSLRFKDGYFLGSIVVSSNVTANEFKANTRGAANDPSFNFSDDDNTGMWSPGEDILGFQVGGNTRATLSSTGLAILGGMTISSTLVVSSTITGNLTGNVTGNVTGNTTGTHTGAVVGNASTATALATPRTIGLTGAATASGSSFDGTANISISVSDLNATNLTAGTLPSARVSGSYTGLTGTGALDAGSITSNFGSINIGSDDVTANAFKAGNGSAADPTLGFSNASTTVGFYRIGNSTMGVAAADAICAAFSSFGFFVNMSSAFAISSDSQTGWYFELDGNAGGSADSAAVLQLRRMGTNGASVNFYKDTTNVGSISVTGSATAYNTSSDYRLKDEIKDLTGSGEFIDSLLPREWVWKSTGEVGAGFVAHELQEVSPSSVVGEKDGEEMQTAQASSSEIMANIVLELQTLRKRVESLEKIDGKRATT